MYRRRNRASARTAILVVASIAATSLVMMAQPALAADDICFAVADKGDYPGDRDFLTMLTVTRGTPAMAELEIGFTGTTGIEALATRVGDNNLYAADKNRLGTVNKGNAAFTAWPKTFGSGKGALGTKTFGNVDALGFTLAGDRLFATQRSEDDPDLLFEVDIATGERKKDAFGANVDYLVVPQPGGRHNVDALATRDNQSFWAIVNKRGGADSVLATIDITTAAVTIINSTQPDPEGLGSSPNGLYAVTGKDFNGNQSYLWEMSNDGNMTNQKAIGGTPPVRIDFEGVECEPDRPSTPLLKFNDKNGDGVRDQGEEGLGGWEFHVIGDNVHLHLITEPDGLAPLPGDLAGEFLICETQQADYEQTAPPPTDPRVADCSGHAHDGKTPGPRGYRVQLPLAPDDELLFGNHKILRCVSLASAEKNARAFGIRADLLGGGLILGDPDIAATPDSDVTNPGQLLSVPNILDPMAPPLVSLLNVSEEDLAAETTATATTAAVDLSIPGLTAFRVQADGIVAKSRSYAETGGASSSSAGSTVANLRIGGVQYGDVSEPLTVVINDPLTGVPFIEVHVLERIRRHAAAGNPQPVGGVSRSGLDVNGIHVVVHDLALTTFLDESSDIIVAHASTDISFTPFFNCPTVSGRAYAARVFNLTPNLAHAIVGEVVLPSSGGQDAEVLADVDLSTLLVADAASTSTVGSVTIEPDTATADSRAVITDADLSGLLTARLVDVDAHASCVSPLAAPTSCPTATPTGSTTIADVHILGTNVCASLGLTDPCQPPVDYVFLDIPSVIKVVFNEQRLDADGRGITVNGVHIWVLGALPGSSLPVGAEIIISSAHADTHKRM